MSRVATSWSVAGGQLDLTPGVLVGVLNVTPDSFSDGGEWDEPSLALKRAESMAAEGALVIDIGGESTRPGADPVSIDEEASRAIPVVKGLVERGITVSIDTYKPEIASLAIEAGASIVNDVTGFDDEAMIGVVAAGDVGVVIMHGRGQQLDQLAHEADVVSEVESHLLARAQALRDAGIAERRIAIDPGLGFAKRHEQSAALIAGIARLTRHGFPVMVGASRKGFLKSVAGADTRESRDNVTAAISAVTFLDGVRLFRVHDVARSRDALRLAGAIVTDQ